MAPFRTMVRFSDGDWPMEPQGLRGHSKTLGLLLAPVGGTAEALPVRSAEAWEVSMADIAVKSPSQVKTPAQYLDRAASALRDMGLMPDTRNAHCERW
jgi:hypothetical protein